MMESDKGSEKPKDIKSKQGYKDKEERSKEWMRTLSERPETVRQGRGKAGETGPVFRKAKEQVEKWEREHPEEVERLDKLRDEIRKKIDPHDEDAQE